jgi:hypothetical protein
MTPTMATPEVGKLPTLPAPMTLEESGLRLDLVVQLTVKALHFVGELSGIEMADRLGVTFPVVEPAIHALKSQHLCEIVGGTSLGPPSYRYRITTLGRERAATFLATSMYNGIAPVPFSAYQRFMTEFRDAVPTRVSREQVRKAFSHLVLSDRVLDQLGPAINAGHSLFVYGPPGNGKSVVSQALGKLLPGDIWIPHAIDVDGSLITVFDPVNHETIPHEAEGPGLELSQQHDRRWVRCKRPIVTVGGELTLEQLELSYSPTGGFYRAPLQLVANGGVLVIDDFGRQQVSPHAILNRWITPLESRVDYLTLQSGQKVAMPFLVLPVFATNIKPVDLVDEAFLRRIHYKVFAESPTQAQFLQIWDNCCRERGLEFDPSIPNHLLHDIYPARNIEMRGCHPRDLIDHALSLARYLGEPQRLTVRLLEAACDGYFVDEDQGIDSTPMPTPGR